MSGHPSTPRTYGEAALRLKASLDLNELDAEFAKVDGNKAFYIFDTNVFIFYAYLDDTLRLTGDIDHLVGRQLDRKVSRAMERLTADFMLSGRLPGQSNHRGYISVPHLEESLGKAASIADKLDREHLETRAAAEHDTQNLRNRMSEILDGDFDPETKLAKLSGFVPAAWLSTLKTSTRFAATMRRAFLDENPLLLPLDQCEEGRAARDLDPADVEEWIEALPDVSDDRSEVAILRDAQALATIVNLYRNDPAARGRRPTQKYLFVTADDELGAAVASRAKWLRGLGIENFVRSPRHYLPILNLTSMRDALGPGAGGHQLRMQFRTVFETLRSALEWLVIGDRALLPDALSASMLSKLQHYWGEISKYVTTLNVHGLTPDQEKIFGELANFVCRPDTAAAAARLVRSTVIEVRDRHMAMTLRSALVGIRRSRQARNHKVGRRAQIKLAGDGLFGSLLPAPMTLDELLDEAVESSRLPPAVFRELKERPSTREAQLLAACLFAAAERWATAAQFAARAVELSRRGSSRSPSNEAREARYLHAICLRFSMDNSRQYELAHRDLEQNLAQKSKSSPSRLLILRDKAELGTLMMTAAVLQEISSWQHATGVREVRRLSIIESTPPTAVFRKGVERLRTADEQLSRLRKRRRPTHDRALETNKDLLGLVRYQITTNLLGAFIFERMLPSLGPPLLAIEDASPLLRRVAEWIRREEIALRPLRPTSYIYYCTARFFSTDIIREKAEVLHDLDQFLGKLKLRHSAMSLDDYFEFTFIRDWLRGELNVIPPALPADPVPEFAPVPVETAE